MNVTIEQDEGTGVHTVRIVGKLDTGSAPEAQRALDALIAGGAGKIVMDFGGLDYISSAGLRVLLVAAKKLPGASVNLRLCALNTTVAEVFEISGFDRIFKVFPSAAEARAGF